MWSKNALFIGLCCLGLAWISTNVLRRHQIHEPKQVQLASQTEVPPGEIPAVTAALDREFQAVWAKQNLQAAERADTLTMVRRLSLGLTGTVPSLQEIRELEKVPEAERGQWWLAYVLEDRRFADYVAERLARPMVGVEDGPFILFRRSRFVGWLANQLEKNRPYDEVVREILAEEGLWTDNPPVNFVSLTIDAAGTQKPDPIKLAARTARTFLATQIDCLQCHDDNLDKINFGTQEQPVSGKQTHFHEFAAFFGEARHTRRGVSDVAGLTYETQYLGSDSTEVVKPQVPFAATAFRTEGRPREQMARWLTDPTNKQFARATVNRIWAIMFGKPLVEPIDDIPLNGPFPPGLELLADDFASHHFDMHRLIRIIASSAVFQVDSQADFEITPAQEAAWAVFPLTRVRPEQMAGAIIQASQLSTIDGESHIFWKLFKFGQSQDFLKRYGDTGTDEFTDRGTTIPQRLLMMNGDVVKERTQQNYLLNAPSRIGMLAPTDAAAVEAAYLATLTRRPSPEESAHFQARLANTRAEARASEMEDLYWTLVNSSEFSWNH